MVYYSYWKWIKNTSSENQVEEPKEANPDQLIERPQKSWVDMDRLERAWKMLTEQQQDILTGLFFEQETPRKLRRRMRLTYSKWNQEKHRAFKKIRDNY